MSRRPAKPATGCYRRDDVAREYPQIVLRFDRETFEQVAALALRQRVSFNEQALTLIEFGLERGAEKAA